jgi:hypothetical protein
MDTAELRHRVSEILQAEDGDDVDWDRVERLSGELLGHIAGKQVECPEIVHHYLDDADIRARDAAYGQPQREAVRRFAETGEYTDSTPAPGVAKWGCATVAALLVGLVLWLLR